MARSSSCSMAGLASPTISSRWQGCCCRSASDRCGSTNVAPAGHCARTDDSDQSTTSRTWRPFASIWGPTAFTCSAIPGADCLVSCTWRGTPTGFARCSSPARCPGLGPDWRQNGNEVVAFNRRRAGPAGLVMGLASAGMGGAAAGRCIGSRADRAGVANYFPDPRVAPAPDPAWLAGLHADTMRESSKAMGAADPRLLDDAGDAEVPVLVEFGGDDIYETAAEKLHRRFPDARHETLTAAGHLPWLHSRPLPNTPDRVLRGSGWHTQRETGSKNRPSRATSRGYWRCKGLKLPGCADTSAGSGAGCVRCRSRRPQMTAMMSDQIHQPKIPMNEMFDSPPQAMVPLRPPASARSRPPRCLPPRGLQAVRRVSGLGSGEIWSPAGRPTRRLPPSCSSPNTR